ncbi:molybdenum cofactor biosynthesis protein MoaE [Rhodohalobacter sp. 8-1]|uniref:molybdenum cofactor biosynthesis protein MoaE n=1 Tax=Rhodohalobacter sp. 8-1 TaxID=3131972 RepID=UPI0030EB288B
MPKSIFVQGAISPQKIAESIAKHQSKTAIGGHSIFLGQIRADETDGKRVAAIEYTAYKEMADKEADKIREEAFDKFDLTCAHIYHSLGRIKTGELCFFVFTSSAHRQAARDANAFLVDSIKERVPIYGKEIFEDESHQWKVNR